MDKKERWELIWIVFVLALFVIVGVATAPLDGNVGGVPQEISQIPPHAKVDNVLVTAYQYYFNLSEHGVDVNSVEQINGSTTNNFYYNILVAHPGDWLNLTMVAGPETATTNFFFPLYNDKVTDVQIVPGLTGYAVFPSPNVTGVYTFINGEYDGPWFSYQEGNMIVIPTSGYSSPSNISRYITTTHQAFSSALVGDPYNPPIYVENTTMTPVLNVVSNDYNVFNGTIPGPTFVVNAGSTVTLNMYVPTPKGDHNYLYNYTTTGKAYPDKGLIAGIYAVWWNGTITPVETTNLTYNTHISFTFNAKAPAYLYGVIYPVFYNYDLDGMSSTLTGEQMGYVMSLWGTVMVES